MSVVERALQICLAFEYVDTCSATWITNVEYCKVTIAKVFPPMPPYDANRRPIESRRLKKFFFWPTPGRQSTAIVHYKKHEIKSIRAVVSFYTYKFDMIQIYTLFSQNDDFLGGCKSGDRLYTLNPLNIGIDGFKAM